MDIWKNFHGLNSGYVMDLYERYVRDSSSVDPATKTIFKGWKPDTKYSSLRVEIEPEIETNGFNQSTVRDVTKAVAIANMAQAIRRHGHLASRIDPLGGPVHGDLTLHAETFGLDEEELRDFPSTLVGWPLAQNSLDALDGIRKLRKIYSSTTGYNYDHIYEAEERRWMRGAIESGVYRPPLNPVNEAELLDTLTKVEVFENFLHRIFPGKFRFSIEGVDMLVPMLNELIHLAIKADIHQIILGMAHRGRLNVMHHVMEKNYKYTLLKFKDPVLVRDFADDMGWTGDVKYHEAVKRDIPTGDMLDRNMRITMVPNPSHLESVNPVVQGMSRACGISDDTPGSPQFDPSAVIPVQIHGDSAFMGQGINAETLNLSALSGYHTGGTIHIITNNQLGYTTLPTDSRSTLYASDLAKGFEIPIVHVNADDPVACIESIRMAFGYTSKFEKHFLIDLVGYRRYGHNEADEPGFTQPMIYKKIDSHPRVMSIWAEKLIEKGTVSEKQVEQLKEEHIKKIAEEFESISPDDSPEESTAPSPERGIAKKTVTKVSDESLRELNDSLLSVPEGFTVNSKIARIRDRRKNVLDDPKEKIIDWAMAEELAYASIVAQGIPIRITGQDCERGTFSHRHAVLHDSETGAIHIPLQRIPQAKAAVEIKNSPLSENACLGFEYGYCIERTNCLVIWEAQYGDFINGAQTIVDEYLVSARAKWGQTPSLVLLLPHAYEGQGPDHSSGRLERFLMSAAEYNIRIVNCTTSAQFFHVLRRQALLLGKDPLPLVVMTPKGLLRNPMINSSLKDLSEGKWFPVIDDPMSTRQAKKVRRLIFCSGKVYIDLISSELRAKSPDVAIARIEQLYPRPKEEVSAVLERYGKLEEVVWVQEEPQNAGAWKYMLPFFRRKIIKKRLPLSYIGRKRYSSPSEGLSSMHKYNQDLLVKQAFSIDKVVEGNEESGITWHRDI